MMSDASPSELVETRPAKALSQRPKRNSRMEPERWIPQHGTSLLDVGCNVGDLLLACSEWYPKMQLAGIDINKSAIEIAKRKLPEAEIHQGFGYRLPFEDDRFDCVTCIEVIEHVPAQHRSELIAEMRRVLRPGGRLVLRCPHAGIFSWLDAQNFRFRWPALYHRLVGDGSRDVHYQEVQEELVWHHHFTRDELLDTAGPGWKVEACEFGGLVLFPISDILRWPFYHLRRGDNWIVRALEKMATLELAVSFGKSSYGILVALQKS
jgi:SAM-dependent methyltransferase